MSTTKGCFKEVPIGHEIKFGRYVGKKIDSAHCEVYYPVKDNEIRYISPCQWVEYNSVYPELIRTDMRVH